MGSRGQVIAPLSRRLIVSISFSCCISCSQRTKRLQSRAILRCFLFFFSAAGPARFLLKGLSAGHPGISHWSALGQDGPTSISPPRRPRIGWSSQQCRSRHAP